MSFDAPSMPSEAPRASPPDVYFSRAYGLAEQACGSGEWVDIQALNGRWRMPLLLRTTDGLTDGVSPYGYSGIYADPELGEEDRQQAWRGAVEELSERQVLSVFLRQSPLVGAPLDTTGFETVVSAHATVCVNTADSDQAWAQMQGRSRTSIRKAERLGLRTAVKVASTSDLLGEMAFRSLYEATMQRRGAAERYYFPDAYYRALAEGLGENLLLATVVDESETPVSAALLLRHGRLLHYHLSGAIPEAGRNGATNLMLWGTIQWASQHGVERFHLGGGVSDGDSLFKFKQSFGGELLNYSAHGVIIDPAGYRSAVVQRASQLNRPVSELLGSAFFPKFRIPS